MRRSPVLRRLILGVAALLAAAGIGWGQAPDRAPLALVAAIEGPIGPATARHVEKAIEAAAQRQAEVLILRINTPGGLATSMRAVIAEILAAPVPVVGYVAPSGAHAASAGTYILYATPIAAMAPGTNLGAATPVQIGGGLPGRPSEDEEGKEGEQPESERPAERGDAMEAKMVNDAVAFIRSLAELHGRNADWAEKAVREAASLSARQALAEGVVNLVADSDASLLAQLDGREVTLQGGPRRLSTASVTIETFEPDLLTRLLSLLSNPNVAFLLLLVGIYGLVFEFANPGSIGPGVAGVICLVLGLYALHQLPLDYAGLALLLLGLAFMVAEAVTPAFGVLGIGGLIAFVVGAAMLVDTEAPAFQLSWWSIGGAALLSGGLLVLLLGYLWRSYRRRGVSDPSGLLGAEGLVLDWSAPDTSGEGYVWIHGERWAARGTPALQPGQAVRVRALEGLTLIVEPEGKGER